MERFTADLHIHSRFSRATSKNLTIRNLAAWARLKGISVLGTGDFTHPEWLAEIEEQLVDNGKGLLVLRDESGLEKEIPDFDGEIPGRTRFMLQAEISSIYKRGGKVRKVHNLIYMPTLDAVHRFNEKLAQVGNLASDGRPILGLDSRDLLDMVLDTHPQAFLVPAHIWTPWFSLFGSKSGFDSIKECFGDYSQEIFAMETGLSSDPEMNWTWSELDRIKLISNSDAHSGEKLGREVNMFRGDISYEGIYRALRSEGLGHKFLGTVEFFPEEGKYHMDGHRKCGVMMDPHETMARGGLCPVCGKPVTVGVYNRILELADRQEPLKPAGAANFTSLIPLREVLGEVLSVGPGSKKVGLAYMKLIKAFGNELDILQRVLPEDLEKHVCHLGEAVTRMRDGNVIRKPGYDGEFGVITVFNDRERAQIKNGATLIDMPAPIQAAVEDDYDAATCTDLTRPEPEVKAVTFNAAQQAAINTGPGPVLVLAGPGTGKTQTLMGRISRLIGEGEMPRRILALTFTRRAAQEMRDRMKALGGEDTPLPQAGTLHSLCFDYWKHAYNETPIVLPEHAAKKLFADVNPEFSGKDLDHWWNKYNLGREQLADVPEQLAEAHINYGNQKNHWDLVDYTDLLEFMLEQSGAPTFKMPYRHVLVDEVQDLTPLQLAVIRGIAGGPGEGLFCIGDPKQSIYGFRGAVGDVEHRLKEIWPEMQTVTLAENYRSGQSILDSAGALFPDEPKLHANLNIDATIHFFEAPDGPHEASWIGDRIKKLIGATSHSIADAEGHGDLAPGDIAVLVRFKALIPTYEKALKRAGIPCSTPELDGFWQEPRVASILKTAQRFLGMTLDGPGCDTDVECIDVPEHILAKGPVGLAAYLAETPPFDQFFWESRQFKELKKAFDERGGWQSLINWVSLQTELELVRRTAEKVQIMTLHAAKGLEFEAVFMPACEEGILPFAGMDLLTATVTLTPGRGQRFAEERRLMYVGMTRAKRSLFISRADKRQLFGKTLSLPESRYLREIPKEKVTKSTLTAKKVTKEKQLGLLD